MSSKASQDRYAVMEAYVTIMKGNPKNLDAVHNRLVEVLSIVIFYLIFRDLNIHQLCWQWQWSNL
mgnify:CR=1 FL=1